MRWNDGFRIAPWRDRVAFPDGFASSAMLRDALAYPARGPNAESNYLHGLVFAFGTALALQLPGVLAAVAVVPGTLLVGLLGGVFEDGVAGGTEPPAVGPLTDVARRGVALVGVAALYLLPAAVVLAATAIGASGSVGSGSRSFGASLRVLAGSTAVLLVVLAAAYLLPVALGAVLEAGTPRAALSPGTFLGTAGRGAYFTAFWTAVILLGAVLGVANVLATLGRPGAAVGVALTFHVLVGTTHLVGRGYGTDGTLYDLL